MQAARSSRQSDADERKTGQGSYANTTPFGGTDDVENLDLPEALRSTWAKY